MFDTDTSQREEQKKKLIFRYMCKNSIPANAHNGVVAGENAKMVVKINDKIANLTLDEYWTEWMEIPEQHFNERDWDMWVYDASSCIVEYIDDDEIVDYMFDKMGGDIEITKIYEFVRGEYCRLEYRYEVDGCNYHPDTKMSAIINEIYNKVVNEDIGK